MPYKNELRVPFNPLMKGELIKLKEASAASGLSVGYLRAIAQSGRLRAKKIGREWLTTLSAIEEYKTTRAQVIKHESPFEY